MKKQIEKSKYHPAIPKICARCGMAWSPKCCDYSYKAVEFAKHSGKNLDGKYQTIAQSNALYKLLNKCNEK